MNDRICVTDFPMPCARKKSVENKLKYLAQGIGFADFFYYASISALKINFCQLWSLKIMETDIMVKILITGRKSDAFFIGEIFQIDQLFTSLTKMWSTKIIDSLLYFFQVYQFFTFFYLVDQNLV